MPGNEKEMPYTGMDYSRNGDTVGRFLLLRIECGQDTCQKETGIRCEYMKTGLHCCHCRIFDVDLPLGFGETECDVKRCEACKAAELK